MAEGVGEVREDQDLTCYCYNIILRGGKPPKSYPVKGLDTYDELAKEHGTPVEELISIPLADGNSEHTV